MSNVRALVRARSVASMHYGLRKASRARLLLLSRCIAFPVQIPQCTSALGGLACPLSLVLAQHRARSGNTKHPAQICLTPLESIGLTALATGQSAQAGPALIVASCLGAYSNWFSRVRQMLKRFTPSGVARSAAFWGAINECPNPSIEGTSNGGAHWFAPSRSATPLAAPHVKR